MIFISSTGTFLTAAEEADDDIELNIYYFEKKDDNSNWLVAYEPEEGDESSINLTSEENLTVSHGIIDRKYDSNIKPEVHLYIDTNGTADLKIHVQMEFYYFSEDNYLPPDPDVIAYFDFYTTLGRIDSLEYIPLASTAYSEVPRDIPQKDYGAILKVVLNLEGGSPGDEIDIYCGKDDYRSYVKTPYAQPYSAADNGDDDSDDPLWAGMTTSCYIIIGIFIAVLVIIVIILHVQDLRKK